METDRPACPRAAGGPALRERRGTVRGSRARPSRAKAMAGHQKGKVMLDEVRHNQILRELYLKELRTQKLYPEYHVNPLRKGEGCRGVEEGERGALGGGREYGVWGAGRRSRPVRVRGRRGWGGARWGEAFSPPPPRLPELGLLAGKRGWGVSPHIASRYV